MAKLISVSVTIESTGLGRATVHYVPEHEHEHWLALLRAEEVYLPRSNGGSIPAHALGELRELIDTNPPTLDYTWSRLLAPPAAPEPGALDDPEKNRAALREELSRDVGALGLPGVSVDLDAGKD